MCGGFFRRILVRVFSPEWTLPLGIVFVLVTCASGAGTGALQQPSSPSTETHDLPAVVVVTSRMIAEDPPPVGVNEIGDMGGTQFGHGNLIPDWGFEAASIRHRYRVTDSGYENGRPWVTLGGPGVSRFDLVASGYMSGADYRIYRIVDDSGRALPEDPERGYLDLSTAARYERVASGRVPEAGTQGLPHGGWVVRSPAEPEERNRVYLERDAALPHRWDYIHFDRLLLEPSTEWSHPRVRQTGFNDIWRPVWDHDSIRIRRVSHVVPPPDDMRHAGSSSLEISSSASGQQLIHGPALFYPATGVGESTWYAFLEPGETYLYEAWMRQDGIADSHVRLTFHQQYESVGNTFVVGSDWELHSFTFSAPEIPQSGAHGMPAISFTGPGTVHVDNIRLLRADQNTSTPGLELPDVRNWTALQAFNPTEGRKGVLRNMWSGLRPYTVPGTLNLQRESLVAFDWFQSFTPDNRPTIPFHLQFAYLTGSGPEDRMVPWINMNPNASVEEWEMLMEYLIEPIDPEREQAQREKPFAYLRYEQRGNSRPWIDEFSHIIIEFANETWHQQAVEEQWAGWGQQYAVGSGGREFAMYVAYVTEHLEETNPRIAQLREDGRLRFSMGDNYYPYVAEGINLVPGIESIGHGAYVGPRWETGDQTNPVLDDDGMQTTLLAFAEGFADDLDTWRREREMFADRFGIHVDFYAYEGGPSGYAIGAPEEEQAVAEAYGKSLAMAVASLEGWLAAYEAGFTEMAFYSFSARETWASHTPHSFNAPHGYNPHTAWLAAQMRNRYASGHMVAVDVPQAPYVERNGRSIPLVSGYAFRDGSRLSVFLLSRKLDGVHSGHDFGDGSTEVTLRLPGNPVGPATLYRLTGDPRRSNIRDYSIRIEEQESTLNQETALTLPAGSIYLFVVDTDLEDSVSPPTRVPDILVRHERGHSVLEWDSVPGADGYVVYRGTREYFSRTEEEARFETTTPSFQDLDAGGGSTYYYRIAARNGWGEGLASLVTRGGTNPRESLFPSPVLAGAAIGDGTIEVFWRAVPGATGYRVGHRTGSSGFHWTDVGTQLSHVFTGLTNNVAVNWAVQAYGPDGRGLTSAASRATPLAAGTAQPLATWSFLGSTSYEETAPVTQRVMGASVGDLVRGSGFMNTAKHENYHPLPNAFGFFPLEEFEHSNFGRLSGGGDLDMAIDRGYFVEFRMTPDDDRALDISSVHTGVTYPYCEAELHVALQHQIGDGPWFNAPSGPFAIEPALWTGGEIDTTHVSFDLAADRRLRQIREPVTIRLYVYSYERDARFCRAGIMRRDGNDVMVYGSVR